jgi:hypothetical protein
VIEANGPQRGASIGLAATCHLHDIRQVPVCAVGAVRTAADHDPHRLAFLVSYIE